ncbi:MAG TPA: hypothetical protein VGF44_05330 [Terriglobales bacterium]|jgi:hypothetical protein
MNAFSFARHSRIIAILAGLLLISACNVDVQKSADGKDKNVQIDTPVGKLHISKDAEVKDTGLSVYPHARVVEKEDNGSDSSANINFLTGFFGLKVVAVEYESDDSLDKVKSYYQGQLKKFGNVLECHSDGANASAQSGDDSKSEALTCEQNSGDHIELKAGVRDNQHIVSLERRDNGCKFSLVYVKIRGKETSI